MYDGGALPGSGADRIDAWQAILLVCNVDGSGERASIVAQGIANRQHCSLNAFDSEARSHECERCTHKCVRHELIRLH
jgi:hypothetical protein